MVRQRGRRSWTGDPGLSRRDRGGRAGASLDWNFTRSRLKLRVWVKNKGYGWWAGRTRGRSRDGGYFVKLVGLETLIRVRDGRFTFGGHSHSLIRLKHLQSA